MKVAISLPDALFHQVEDCARRDRVSRSRVMALAARDYLARRRMPSDPTAAWNRAIARSGQPGVEPGHAALRALSLATLRGRPGKW